MKWKKKFSVEDATWLCNQRPGQSKFFLFCKKIIINVYKY